MKFDVQKRKKKGPFRAKNGKMAQKDPKMAFLKKKEKKLIIFGPKWENGHFAPQMGKWPKKTLK